VRRLQELCPSTAIAQPRWPRRGCGRQQSRRTRERTLRENLVDFCGWATARGWTLLKTAARLDLVPRTLRQWQHDCHSAHQTRTLGRPTARAPRLDRQAVLEILEELGPGVGVPTLHACCPTLARAELADFLQRYRRVWKRLHQEAWHVLHWPEPGRIWAIDYAEPPLPIDSVYRALLAVRDLASGRQLLWLPVTNPVAEEVVRALTSLFTVLGAPLILKSDNGSPFSAGTTQALLATFGHSAVLTATNPTVQWRHRSRHRLHENANRDPGRASRPSRLVDRGRHRSGKSRGKRHGPSSGALGTDTG
jgi:hypothetical protein